MGADKAVLQWAGRRAVGRLVDVAAAIGAASAHSVGFRPYGVPFIADEAPGGGPVAGIIAGLAALERQRRDRALILAVDAPTITAEDLSPLLATPAPGAAFAQLHLPLLIHLSAVPSAAGPGWSMARLITEARLALVEPAAESRLRLRGANTPEERAALLAELAARERAQKPGAG
jgi:molybdopterin-guanine dinucleotide biosynthesis protein A